ncbi:MAG TPA: NAD(P)-binding domain-containing protein, partial [Microbacterium sp.]|nr:NAD(P)-binding domain-containing protein [Microbacterium sp.]
MRIAFLGLGHMGLPMAQNLIAAGHDVSGYDVVPQVRDAAASAGVPIAGSGTDAAASAEVVITMFPAGVHVLSAYREGLLAAAPAGTLFIESSTIAVADAQE